MGQVGRQAKGQRKKTEKGRFYEMIYKRDQHWHMDATINGNRYREALKTTDWREAQRLEKKRLAEIQQGKGASKTGRDFARKPFEAAADLFLADRKPHVSERTAQLEKQQLKALRKFFREKPLLRIQAEDIAAYQRQRREFVSGTTLNMEIGVLRQMMRRAKVWNVVAEDVKMDRENVRPIAKVLTVEEKKLLFHTAASRSLLKNPFASPIHHFEGGSKMYAHRSRMRYRAFLREVFRHRFSPHCARVVFQQAPSRTIGGWLRTRAHAALSSGQLS